MDIFSYLCKVMKIKGWDKLRYRGVFICGAGLTISSTYQDRDNFYTLEMDDADNVGNTLLRVTLEAKDTEFFMTAYIVPTQIYPNVKRVFRKNDMDDVDVFLKGACDELFKNRMINSYLTLIAEIQKEKQRSIFNSSSISLPF